MGQSGQNFAFIDANNLHLSVIGMGWKLDYRKFRRYLSDKYHVSVAYYFIGEIPGMESLYSYLSNIGYSLVFKPPIIDKTGNYKGNVDAELVLQAVIDLANYDKAVIITSDGDFSCLINYLNSNNKLERLLASSRGGCSKYLRKAAGSKVDYMDALRSKLEYTK
jgi:uncharacterized LabA/DUF88 family protein